MEKAARARISFTAVEILLFAIETVKQREGVDAFEPSACYAKLLPLHYRMLERGLRQQLPGSLDQFLVDLASMGVRFDKRSKPGQVFVNEHETGVASAKTFQWIGGLCEQRPPREDDEE